MPRPDCESTVLPVLVTGGCRRDLGFHSLRLGPESSGAGSGIADVEATGVEAGGCP